MRRTAPLIALLIAAAPAQATDHDLWATVNVCDTPAKPDSMGVRASMPGNGTKQRMYMRFNATWYSKARQAWYPVKGNGRSKWIYVGNAKFRARQGGWTFEFAPPAPTTEFVVRGVVEFQWRKRKKVVDRAVAKTRHGIPGVAAGDPPGTSEGLCVIKP